MVSQIFPLELQLNKANTSDTGAATLDLHLSISNDIVSTKIYDKRDDFNFEIINFTCLGGDVPRSIFYGVYIHCCLTPPNVLWVVLYAPKGSMIRMSFKMADATPTFDSSR